MWLDERKPWREKQEPTVYNVLWHCLILIIRFWRTGGSTDIKAAQSESGATACVVTETLAGSSGSSSQPQPQQLQQPQQQKEGNEPLVVLNNEASDDGVQLPSTAGLYSYWTMKRLVTAFSHHPLQVCTHTEQWSVWWRCLATIHCRFVLILNNEASGDGVQPPSTASLYSYWTMKRLVMAFSLHPLQVCTHTKQWSVWWRRSATIHCRFVLILNNEACGDGVQPPSTAGLYSYWTMKRLMTAFSYHPLQVRW